MSRENQVMETKKIKECAYLRSVRWTCPLLCSSAGRRHGGSLVLNAHRLSDCTISRRARVGFQ